jgi:hypothetical protein
MRENLTLRTAYDRITCVSIKISIHYADIYDHNLKSYFPEKLQILSLQFEESYIMKSVAVHRLWANLISESKIKCLKLK